MYRDLNATKEKKAKFEGVYNRKATATIKILCQYSYLLGRVWQQLKFYNKNRIVRAVCQCQPGWEVSHLLLSERPAVLPCSWILPAEITGSSADCNTKITGDSLSCFLGATNDIPSKKRKIHILCLIIVRSILLKQRFFPLNKLGPGLFDLIAVLQVLSSANRELTPFWQAFLNWGCTVLNTQSFQIS